MKISHGTRPGKIKPTNGYGVATVEMLASLRRLGYEVNKNDEHAAVEMWFDQPQHWKFHEHPYKIGYHPWESTLIKPSRLRAMFKADEVWTPSPIVADWYRDWGLPRVYVYEHGVGHQWTVQDRQVTDKIRFLHLGLEALRKGGHDTMEAFRTAFAGRDDVSLTMKTSAKGWELHEFGHVTVKTEMLSEPDLIEMFHQHHVFVCPSYGEGFGLPALQAMATGMPTICTGAWAPYVRFLDPNLTIGSTMIDSPWPEVHPGKMFQPNFDDLVDRLRYAADHYAEVQTKALALAPTIHTEYDWDSLTSHAFNDLRLRF